jgi:hypothetical protein
MRCLHCGNELALLKKLTGGEFCSEGHRQKYKEEYTRLALGRLLETHNARPEPPPIEPEIAAKSDPVDAPPPAPKPVEAEPPHSGFILRGIGPMAPASAPVEQRTDAPNFGASAPVLPGSLQRATTNVIGAGTAPVEISLQLVPAAAAIASMANHHEFQLAGPTYAGLMIISLEEDVLSATRESEQEPAPKTPRRADDFLNIAFSPAPPVAAESFGMRPAHPPSKWTVELPVQQAIPLRPKVVFGSAPELKTVAAPAITAPVNEQSSRPAKPPKAAEVSKSVESAAPVTAKVLIPRREAERLPDPVVVELPAPRLASAPANGSKRVAVAAGFVIALTISGLLLKSTFASKTAPATSSTETIVASRGLVMQQDGWIADWGGAGPQGRRISMYRPSENVPDYRIEFQGQIENRSIGWIYRAASPANYYASRIAMTKSGLNPTVVVTHFAVINGQESERSEKPLPFEARLDTLYKVRTDVYGSQFKTYLQGQLVDSWTDDRLKSGAFGLLSERSDRTQVRLVQLFELQAGRSRE